MKSSGIRKACTLGVFTLALLMGCGDDGDGAGTAGDGDTASGGSTGPGTGGSSGTGGAVGSGGSAVPGMGTGGDAPARPENPRDDIGAPDGVVCQGDDGGPVACGVGEQCCPSGVVDGGSQCVTPGEICDNCTSSDCGAVQCDGPEDCPGQLCCLTQTSCEIAGAPCYGRYVTTRCMDVCEHLSESDLRSVVCKEQRDCLRSNMQCQERSRSPFVSDCG